MKKLLFSIAGRHSRHARNESREKAIGGTVVAVHRFQQGARDILVDNGSDRSYVFIPAAARIRDIRKGETVCFTVQNHGDGHRAVSVA
jgi:phage/plasmid primase-like uncharacterized protein